MEKMLINATQLEEVRVALVKGQQLFDLDIERPSDVKKKANIYKCRITRIEPSLEAVFVEYGSKRQGFLPVKEIAKTYFLKQPNEEGPVNIREMLREGQELMIQVDKEERGNKGAALTTFITLAGCYLVLMPNNPGSGGISRRIEGDERDEMRDALQNLALPEGMGLIIRTAGVGKGEEDLKWDLEILLNQWKAIHEAYERQPAPFLIYQEGDVVIRSIRDNLRRSIEEIVVDDHIAYAKAKNFIELVMPSMLPRLKLYNDPIPLFSFYQVEGQIEAAHQRTVLLPSGGVLVIDRTEALVAIDINSARSTTGTDIENTALNTNLEAADEIARQLRLRDLGGLIVIDFIDMSSSRNQRDVENRLREALEADRAKIQIGRISRFGLLEMSRQRIRLSLNESVQEICPHCEGKGLIRRPQFRALSLMRLIEEEASKNNETDIHVQLPIDMATFLINEKRAVLLSIEKRHRVNVVILPNPHMDSIQYKIGRAKRDDIGKPSFEQITLPELTMIQRETIEIAAEQPAVQSITTMSRPVDRLKTEGLTTVQASLQNATQYVKRLWNTIFCEEEGTPEAANAGETPPESGHHRRGHGTRRYHNNGHGGGQRTQGGRPRQHQNNNRAGQGQQAGQQQQRRPAPTGGASTTGAPSAARRPAGNRPAPRTRAPRDETPAE